MYARENQNISRSEIFAMVSSVQDGIYALGKAHISQIFPQHSFWNSSNVRLIDDDPLSFFHGRSSNASSFHTSLLQINGVMSLALCLEVVSQAPQNFRSSETQATCNGCCCCCFLFVCLFVFKPVYFLHHFPSRWHVQGSIPKGGFECPCRPLTHSSSVVYI